MRLGRYTLVKTIAQGGMGEVFLAQPRDSDALVAIKRVLPLLEDNEDVVDMFTDEVRITTMLKHDNLAEAFGVERDGESLFLVMEYIPGKNLQQVCQRGVARGPFLPRSVACRIISHAAAGLHHAHNLKNADGEPLHLVHRDVSPPNIMVSFHGEVKIIDFGIALADDNISAEGDEHFKGKFGYMSPEQAMGERIDHRSDIFALGTILYEITARTRLFRAKTQDRARELIAQAKIVPPTLRDPDYPEALEEIVMRALQRDPDARYQSAFEMHQALEAHLAENNIAVTHRQVARYMERLFEDNNSTVIPTIPQLQSFRSALSQHPSKEEATPPSTETPEDPAVTETTARSAAPMDPSLPQQRALIMGITVGVLLLIVVGVLYFVAS